MGKGLLSARKLRLNRKKFKSKLKAKLLKLWKLGPMAGTPQASGIVIKKIAIGQKRPDSGLIKCVRVKLIKNGKEVTAFVPYPGGIHFIEEHDKVTIEGLGGSQGGPIGSQWGIKFKVVKVNDISLKELVKGKKEKPKR